MNTAIEWLSTPATIGDVLGISVLAACLLGLISGSGAEAAAKAYARDLFERLK